MELNGTLEHKSFLTEIQTKNELSFICIYFVIKNNMEHFFMEQNLMEQNLMEHFFMEQNLMEQNLMEQKLIGTFFI